MNTFKTLTITTKALSIQSTKLWRCWGLQESGFTWSITESPHPTLLSKHPLHHSKCEVPGISRNVHLVQVIPQSERQCLRYNRAPTIYGPSWLHGHPKQSEPQSYHSIFWTPQFSPLLSVPMLTYNRGCQISGGCSLDSSLTLHHWYI